MAMMESLVALALAGIALAGLAGAAGLAVKSLRQACDTATAIALAAERLEALRAGPRAAGADASTSPDGTRFDRSWSVADGRGEATALTVQVGFGSRRLTLATRVMP